MCLQQRFIKNQYTGDMFLAKCGLCPACQQEKANRRRRRILDNVRDGHVVLMCNLTYDNKYVPYIKLSELLDKPTLVNVYRDYNCRYVWSDFSDNRKKILKDFKVSEPIAQKLVDEGIYENAGISGLRFLSGKSGCIGVVHYADIQNFFKSLRQDLFINHGYTGKIEFYACSEYGETYQRPHFHALVFIDRQYQDACISSIRKCWRFDRGDVTRRKCEVAIDAASYVASYVNCGSDFPLFLRQSQFRPRNSYSKGFGFAEPSFSLSEVLKAIDRRTMCYTTFVSDGVQRVARDLLLPKYVVSKYFPRFTGYRSLDASTLALVLAGQIRLSDVASICEIDRKDIHKFQVAIDNSRSRFKVATGLSDFDFAFYHQRAWYFRNMSLLKLFYDEHLGRESYSNLSFVLNSSKGFECLPPEYFNGTLNPNMYDSNLVSHSFYESFYYNHMKKRHVNDVFYNNFSSN